MRSALRTLIQWLQEKAILHPSAATLMTSLDNMASLDGELQAGDSARVKRHLGRCAACRNRLEQLQAGLRLYEDVLHPLAADFPLEQGLAHLRGAIQAWNDQHPDSGQAEELGPALPPAVSEKLVAELSIYMGLRTAKAVLQTCNRPGVRPADLTAVIEPLVASFFGRQTGSAVATTVVRIWSRAQGTAA
ncbi:MAG: zf-HC2 domain-containing protein [Acidobacteriia bacterium]|nr:zf-HC2 domain-containing protein [Terriglobia bacterium]